MAKLQLWNRPYGYDYLGIHLVYDGEVYTNITNFLHGSVIPQEVADRLPPIEVSDKVAREILTAHRLRRLVPQAERTQDGEYEFKDGEIIVGRIREDHPVYPNLVSLFRIDIAMGFVFVKPYPVDAFVEFDVADLSAYQPCPFPISEKGFESWLRLDRSVLPF